MLLESDHRDFIHLAMYFVLITLFTVTHRKYMNSFSTIINSTVQCLFINDTEKKEKRIRAFIIALEFVPPSVCHKNICI